MKITRSRLRKIILERLLTEAPSVEQAEAAFEKRVKKLLRGLNYDLNQNPSDVIEKSLAYRYDGAEINDVIKQLESPEQILSDISIVIPEDVSDDARANSIYWLLDKFRNNPGLFFAIVSEETLRIEEEKTGDFVESVLCARIKDSLEKHGQYKQIFTVFEEGESGEYEEKPDPRRDLSAIKDVNELFYLIRNNEEKIEEKNAKESERISAENLASGFIRLRGDFYMAGGKIDKNPATGFYTQPDSEGIVIGEIHTKAAAVKIGTDSGWCTAAPGLDYFKNYYRVNDPLIYVEDNGKRYQFSYGMHEFRTEQDAAVPRPDLIKYSKLVWEELRQRYSDTIVNKYPKITIWMIANNVADDFSDELIMTIINDENIDVDVLKSFAVNPNTPIEGLKKISENFAWGSAVLNNPALTQEVVDYFVKYHVERHNLDGQKILALVNLTNLDTPKEVFAINNNYAFDALTAKRDLTPEIIAYVLEKGSDKSINALLRNKNLRPEFLKFIYESGKLKSLANFVILQNPRTPESVLRSAYEKSPLYHTAISANMNTPSNILSDIANHSKVKLNSTAVYNIINSPNLTKSILDLYIDRMINGELLASERQLISRLAVFIVKNSPLVTKSDIAKIKNSSWERAAPAGYKLERFWNKNNPDDQIAQSSENDQNLAMVSERWLQIAGLIK